MKRFTATDKWAKEWFQELPCRLKCFWSFLCDNADAAGVWEPNFRLASFQIGEVITEADMNAIGDRVEKLKNGKFHIKGFLEFQYGRISGDCKAHIPVIRALEKHSLSIAYPKALQYLQETEEEKDKETEEDQEGKESAERKPDHAEAIYSAYPKKTGRQEALKHIRVALRTVTWQALLEKTLAYASAVAAWPAADRVFIPDPERWYRKGRWDDDPATWLRQNNNTPKLNGRPNADQRTASERERDRTGIEAARIPTETF